MEDLQLHDVVVFLAAAGLVIPTVKRLNVSPVLGFLLIGLAIGPYGLARFVEGYPWLRYLVITNTDGVRMLGRAIARHGYPALNDGREVGRVTSGSFAPFLRKSSGLAYLPEGMWEPGTRFEVCIRKRTEPAEVVATPFYKRDR